MRHVIEDFDDDASPGPEAGTAGAGQPDPGEPTRPDRERRLWRRQLLTQFVLFLVVLLIWPLPVVNPVKLLVVLIHELGHVAAAYATGGVVFGIAIDPGGAGVTLGMDGNPACIMAMGYLCSLIVGLLLYTLVTTWEPGQVWGVLSILTCLTLALGWLNEFTAVFGWGALILLLIGAFKLSSDGKKLILRWVATTCCLYPVIDVASEAYAGGSEGFLVNGKLAGSDVAQLAQLKGMSETLIAAIWIISGLVAVTWMIIWSAKYDARELAERSEPPRPRNLDDFVRGVGLSYKPSPFKKK